MAVQISSNSITVPQDGTFDRNVTIGGTLTYDDVTNIDSVGLVTARTGIEIGAKPGVAASISADGNMIVSGISTFDGTVKVGSGCTITTAAVLSLQANSDPQIKLLDDNGGFAATQLLVENGGRDFKVTTPEDTIFVQGSTEAVRILSDGKVGIGTDVPAAELEVQGEVWVRASANNQWGKQFRGRKDRVGAIVQDDDTILTVMAQGYDGSNYKEAARINFEVDGSPGTNDMPGRICFKTTADGSGSASERARIDNSGRFLLGHTSDIGYGFRSQLVGTDGNTSSFSITRFTNSASGGNIVMSKSRNGTPGSKTIVQDGDNLGQIQWRGDDGVDYKSIAASIHAEVAGSPGAGDMPGSLVFGTTADGAEATTERMRIRPDGDISLGTTNHNSFVTINSGTGANAISIRNTTGGDGTVGVLFSTQDHSGGREKAGIFHVETHGEAHYGGDLLFCLNSATGGATQVSTSDVRMRVRKDGNVLIGKAIGDAGSGGVAGIECPGGSNYLMVTRSGGTTCYLGRNTNAGIILNFLDDGTSVGTVSTNGNSLPSDRNFKKNINSLPLGLNLIEKLNPISYNYKFEKDGAPLKYGLIAQDLEKSLEEVGVEKDSAAILQYTEELSDDPNLNDNQSKYSLSYEKLIPILINAVKELSAEVQELKSKS